MLLKEWINESYPEMIENGENCLIELCYVLWTYLRFATE
jgi:hypothetical protein